MDSNHPRHQTRFEQQAPLQSQKLSPPLAVDDGTRDLPPHWVRQWDPRYRMNYYVNVEDPSNPQPQWDFPLAGEGGPSSDPGHQNLERSRARRRKDSLKLQMEESGVPHWGFWLLISGRNTREQRRSKKD
ncbi:hypothetical protein T439DRAFT_126351 [Meredithblackwellia eburnea MCA 4105]